MWFQKISIPPPRKGFAVYPPSPLDFSKIGPKIYSPSPPEFPKFFAHSSEILLSLIEVNKVVLLARMPNFVSFMYFLLNCITDRQILMPTPYALKSQTNFVSFMYFLLNSTTDNISEFLLRSSHEEIVEKVLGHTKI